MLPAHRRDAYFGDLKLPADPAAAVGVLKGRSNFLLWHSAIQPLLLSNPYCSGLILGTWTEPHFSVPSSAEDQLSLDEERRRWHAANTGTCRFIRETLAANVIPFVRRYNTAKTLFFNVVWLYGEDAGIDTQGGPSAPVNAHMLNAKRGRASLLAALEAKRTLDHLPPVNVAFRLPIPPTPTPTTPTSIQTVSSSSSNTESSTTREGFKTPHPASDLEVTAGLHATLISSFERTQISSDRNLQTIQEHEEPHPGRRVRISSGYAVGFKHRIGDDQSQRSISPFSLADSASENEDDDFHHEDTSQRDRLPRPKKRQASAELETRPSKTSIASIMKTVKPAKIRKRDKFAFSFPLRRLDADKAKGKDKALAC